VTLLAMRRERCPTRVMLLVIWIRVWCARANCSATLRVRRPGFDMHITLSRACDCPVLLHMAVPADRWLLDAVDEWREACRGCGGWDPLRPMPDMQTTKGRDVRRPIFCFMLSATYMSVSRHCYVPAARACRADHCEVGGDHFVQFLRRVWQLQYLSASQWGCVVAASAAAQIIAEWRWPHRPPGPSIFRPGRKPPCRARRRTRCY